MVQKYFVAKEGLQTGPYTLQEITHDEDIKQYHAFIQQLMDGKAKAFTFQQRYLRKDGQIIWTKVTAQLLQMQLNTARSALHAQSAAIETGPRLGMQQQLPAAMEGQFVSKLHPSAYYALQSPSPAGRDAALLAQREIINNSVTPAT